MFNDIRIVRSNGGLGYEPPSEDATSGLLCYVHAVPAALASQPILRLGSLAEAQAANITHSGDTQVLWYHIAEFFRIAQQATLYICVLADDGFDGQYTAVGDLQRFANGEIRQCGIYTPNQSLTAAHLANLQSQAETLAAAHMPVSLVLAPKVTSSDLTELIDLTTLTHSSVSVLIGQDGGGLGAHLKTEHAQHYPTVSCIGACMGAIARAKVSESIAWVDKFNLVSTAYAGQAHAELAIPALADGTRIRHIIPSQLATLHTKGYLFLRQHVGIGGTYFHDAPTADKPTSDLNSIYANRTLDKVSRVLRTTLLPNLSAPIQVNDSGQIEAGTLKYWETQCAIPLQRMQDAAEISAYAITIDPAQNVITKRQLHIAVNIVPIGVAKSIVVHLSFALQIA